MRYWLEIRAEAVFLSCCACLSCTHQILYSIKDVFCRIFFVGHAVSTILCHSVPTQFTIANDMEHVCNLYMIPKHQKQKIKAASQRTQLGLSPSQGMTSTKEKIFTAGSLDAVNAGHPHMVRSPPRSVRSLPAAH